MATKKRERTTKKDYIKSITKKYAGLEKKFREVEKLRKNHKERINPAYTSGITSIKNLAGTYKRTSRAGQLKMSEKSLNQLTLNELKRLNRLFELQEQKKMYSAIDKDVREEAWELAYTSFKNASKYKGKRGEDIVARRSNMSEQDYKNMIYLFEKMEGDYLHAYGSEVVENFYEMYEDTEGQFNVQTLYDAMTTGIQVAKEASGMSADYSKRENEIAQEFVWYWADQLYGDPDMELDEIVEGFKTLLSEGGI